MPHCIVEHSANLSSSELMPLVFEAVRDSGLFEADGSDIKVRAIPYQDYLVGTGGGTRTVDFIHIELKILSGRTPEQKQHLSRGVLEQIKTLALQPCSMTVEVVDMDRASYAKCVG